MNIRKFTKRQNAEFKKKNQEKKYKKFFEKTEE